MKKQKQDKDPLAGRFKLIHNKLNDFANKHNAEIATTWKHFTRHEPDHTDSFAIKRIIWSDSPFGKAIVIQPHNDISGVDTTTWDFTNIAWLDDGVAGGKPVNIKHLLTRVNFEVIEKNIDDLLAISEKNLREIKKEDLK